jgi:Zn-dependent M28 family amino/carboxypeptidase
MVDAARKITEDAKGKTRAWERLAEMADRFGHRLSGSKGLEGAVTWTMERMAKDGLENSRREKVMVPHWVRGKESARIIEPVERELKMLGLGGSVGTRGRPLRAELVVVDHVDEIAKRSEEMKDKIVLINQKMPPYDQERRQSGYGKTVIARSRGAIEGARHGAKAVLIRSVTTTSQQNPHTGAMGYADGVPKIPAAALTIEGAEYLARWAKRGRTRVELKMQARTLRDAESANVVAELPGREIRDEFVVVGCHLDSWDVGDGSSDDGAGCIMAMEAALILKELGLVPRRTIRVVLFTNEENGVRGARAYYEAHGKEKHAGGIEADSGADKPRGFSVGGTDEQVREIQRYSALFAGLGASVIEKGWGGVDISPMMKDGMVGVGVRPEAANYFDMHHSPADTVDKIDPHHLQANAAAMALMAFILAER